MAKLAGVNRGTAYQHFQTREQLIEATAAWVSDKLYRAVFGDPDRPAEDAGTDVDSREVEAINARLVAFAMENPALGRIWLFEVLSSSRPSSDPFWRQYASSFERFAKTNLAQPGIDTESYRCSFSRGLPLAGLGAPTRAHRKGRGDAERYAREVLRLTLRDLRPENIRTSPHGTGRHRSDSLNLYCAAPQQARSGPPPSGLATRSLGARQAGACGNLHNEQHC